jgi:hypothetical protein
MDDIVTQLKQIGLADTTPTSDLILWAASEIERLRYHVLELQSEILGYDIANLKADT